MNKKTDRQCPKEVLASAILKHLADTRTLYPLPPGAEIRADLPEEIPFDGEQFTSLAKRDFANYHAVFDQQITRWINAGLPELADGRIPFQKANDWLEENRSAWMAKKNERTIAAHIQKLQAEKGSPRE